MTGVCPRCRAPLGGSVCTACGARFDVPPGAPPVSAFPPPPQMQMQMPMPGFGPHPYMMYQPMPFPTAPVARGKGLAVAGGIMSIITGAIILLLTVLATSKSELRAQGNVMTVLVICYLLGGAAIGFGIYAVKARWGACLGAGITLTISMFIGFIFIGVIEAIKKERLDRLYDYDYGYGGYDAYDYADGLSRSDLRMLEAIAGGFILLAVVALVGAIFCYIGISSSRAYQRYKAQSEAVQSF